MSKDLEKAKELLKSGKFAHVLCKGDQFFVSCETGTEPLANWARGGITITGGAAASKVITKKSIAFYLMLEVKEVYAPVIDFFYFEVSNVGESEIVAKAGEFTDKGIIRKVSCFRGKLWFAGVGLMIKKKMNAGKKNKGEKNSGGFDVDLKSAGGGMMQMMGGFTVLRLASMMGMANVNFTKEELLKMNKKLNRIRKPKK